MNLRMYRDSLCSCTTEKPKKGFFHLEEDRILKKEIRDRRVRTLGKLGVLF